MSEGDSNEKGFVVKDRRRFDSSGNERSEDTSKAESEPTAAASSGSPKKAPQENKPKEHAAGGKDGAEQASGQTFQASPQTDEAGELNFASFIMSLATQALMQLGEIKPPPGMELEVDKAAARQTIDIIAMLQNKTKGNLDKDESHLIEQILHNLRLSYVKAVS